MQFISLCSKLQVWSLQNSHGCCFLVRKVLIWPLL